jgi:hypothetical protein
MSVVVVLGFCVVTSVILLLFATTVLRVFTDFWLGRWINDGNENEVKRFCEVVAECVYSS